MYIKATFFSLIIDVINIPLKLQKKKNNRKEIKNINKLFIYYYYFSKNNISIKNKLLK